MAERKTPIVQICEVISIDDPDGGDRIKVRIPKDDNRASSLDEISYAFPLLPKMFYVVPKEGEAVLVFNAIAENGFTQRYYIGPVISQLNKIENDSYKYGATSFLKGSKFKPDVNPENNVDNVKGAFPKKDSIAILGRKNSDIEIRDNDIRIKAGVKHSNIVNRRSVTFNKKNPAYLKLKYHSAGETEADNFTTATLVADYINLIGNNRKDYFNTTDRDELVTDETMQDIIKKAHQLPYGDVLIEFLAKMRTQLMTHTHPFPTFPPCATDSMKALQEYKLNEMLSETVRIN